MLHVVTVHHHSDAWIEPQLRFLARHAPADTRVWAILDGVDRRWHARFHRVIEFEGPHPRRLNELARVVSDTADASDELLFLDGDAFPVAPFSCLLAGVQLAAVRRDENLGDPQPHPSFCLTTVGHWNEIAGDWRVGYRWRNSAGQMVTDVGGRLLAILGDRAEPWLALTRVNTHNLHPLWFGLYGDRRRGAVVYHHGAGFRSRVARVDRRDPNFDASEADRQEQVAAEVFDDLCVNDDFFARFLA